MSDSQSYETLSLASGLNFTGDDLIANRNGRLSDAQAARLRSRAGCSIIVGTVLVLALAGSGIWLALAEAWLWSIAFFVMAGGLFWLNRSGRASVTTERQNGQVAMIKGEAILSADDYASPNRKMTEYILTIGDEAFVLSKDAFSAFEDGDIYTVYYLPKARIVLSAESAD